MAIHKFDSPQRKSQPLGALIALGFIAFGAWRGSELVMLQSAGVLAQGTVVRVERTHNLGTDRNNFTYHSVVQFETADGREATFTSGIGFGRPIDTEGDTVAVIYDPANLERAIIDRGPWNWALPGGFLLTGGLALVRSLLRRS